MPVKHPKAPFILLIMIALLTCMLIIIKHNNEINQLQEKIYDHSEIKILYDKV